ncbi:hypothetical protein [Paraburkholderia strydomiana]|uniref:hypothetical protein n=1 Tax=Paraburkholderia strydomiana TaxID=1245417 RepID=UPI0020360767|nr:hypothetical protein [Paraburkholderia strydomiana]
MFFINVERAPVGELTDEQTKAAEQHAVHSVLRERIVEHLFIGHALQRLWQRGVTDVEVLRSEFDAGGYDLVMGFGKVVRHIQFKTVTAGGRATSVTANLKLTDKPSGCILCVVVAPSLAFDANTYLWLGEAPGMPLTSIRSGRIARHTRANSQGMKPERAGHRVLALNKFVPLGSLDAVLERLFGPLP